MAMYFCGVARNNITPLTTPACLMKEFFMALNGRKEKANPTELFIYLNGNSLIFIGEAALFKMAFRTSIRNGGLETEP